MKAEMQNIESAPVNKFVLLVVESGYTTTPHDFIMAQQNEGRWRDVSNNYSFSDKVIVGWLPLPELPLEKPLATGARVKFKSPAILKGHVATINPDGLTVADRVDVTLVTDELARIRVNVPRDYVVMC